MISRSDHAISRANISENALKVLYRLNKAGYQGYLVGGGVRDLLLGREPKDFDVVTNARPDEVRALFRNCRLIGRRFRLAHVQFGREIIEVATFRALHDNLDEVEETEGDIVVEENGRILRDNVYGDSLEEDAARRDFTINALYYDISDYSLVDFAGGMADLKSGTLRLIGDPDKRFREDAVRMLRAVRFAAKLGFRIEPGAEAAILKLGALLEEIPAARLYEEVLKLFHAGQGLQSFELLRHYNLFTYLFPETELVLAEEAQGFPHMFVVKALANTDERIAADKPVNPAFLFAALLWEPVRRDAEELEAGGMPEVQAIQVAGNRVMEHQSRAVSIPKRFKLVMQEIWGLQPRLNQRGGRRPFRLLEHPRLRAAYDFLLLRAEGGEPVAELAEWWSRFLEAEGGEREALIEESVPAKRPRSRRRRGGRGRRGGGGGGGDAQ